ncbi:MAG: hypothetical protein IPJ89_02125 [Candidatus Iainarchaeum archaeon]|uniref:Uncharacterized protein n=1 Tax=Candidatus Iainarchaeum sp. TaxID=3101447 RepID=A0A7T9DKI7_9ARCH|nr:MAG: hypothetical protein IPJ89_02125 [Candidatus Diapherotrites archaeon]
MRLGVKREELASLGNSALLYAIKERRDYLRWHRDQKLDDRCWIDDLGLWEFLDSTPAHQGKIPSFEEGMRLCKEFYAHRRMDVPDPLPGDAVSDPHQWDVDLTRMHHGELVDVLHAIQQGIQAHSVIGSRPRTHEDDRTLYALLPEKIPADFRLPPEPEFLGEAKAPRAGCPSFWRSHSNCKTETHDLHRWGPCK